VRPTCRCENHDASDVGQVGQPEWRPSATARRDLSTTKPCLRQILQPGDARPQHGITVDQNPIGIEPAQVAATVDGGFVVTGPKTGRHERSVDSMVTRSAKIRCQHHDVGTQHGLMSP